jgi:diacylglycerol kinase family enzyme
MRKVLVLLNRQAGTLIDSGAEGLRDSLQQALGRRAERVDIRLLKPREMSRAIRNSARTDHDTIVIGGGDGSASLAAATLANSGKVLGILPLGTMNLLGNDLGMPPDPSAAIAALADAQETTIDLAGVNGRPFHSLSGMGFFSQMARAREETRGHPLGRLASVALAAMRAMRRSGSFDFDVTIDGKRQHISALAVLVTNNRFGPDWRRPRLDAGTLELHIMEEAGALPMLKASAGLLSGTWRTQEGIRSIAAGEVVINHLRRRTWISTDGELLREAVPVRYRVLPSALKVLRAAPAG